MMETVLNVLLFFFPFFLFLYFFLFLFFFYHDLMLGVTKSLALRTLGYGDCVIVQTFTRIFLWEQKFNYADGRFCGGYRLRHKVAMGFPGGWFFVGLEKKDLGWVAARVALKKRPKTYIFFPLTCTICSPLQGR